MNVNLPTVIVYVCAAVAVTYAKLDKLDTYLSGWPA